VLRSEKPMTPAGEAAGAAPHGAPSAEPAYSSDAA
jgi:hypothetical protein